MASNHPDTPENTKKLRVFLNKVGNAVKDGSFRFKDFFPRAKAIDQNKFATIEAGLPIPHISEANQSVEPLVGEGRGNSHLHGTTGSTFKTLDEREVYFKKLNELKQCGCYSREQMEQQAMKAVEQWRTANDYPF